MSEIITEEGIEIAEMSEEYVKKVEEEIKKIEKKAGNPHIYEDIILMLRRASARRDMFNIGFLYKNNYNETKVIVVSIPSRIQINGEMKAGYGIGSSLKGEQLLLLPRAVLKTIFKDAPHRKDFLRQKNTIKEKLEKIKEVIPSPLIDDCLEELNKMEQYEVH
jgi:hypothetical protein